MKSKVSAKLLNKYLRGECSEEEISLIDKWYETFDENDDLLSTLSEEEQAGLKHNMLSRIDQKIQGQPEGFSGRSVIRNLIYVSSGIAAAFLLFFAFQYLDVGSVKEGFIESRSDETTVYNTTKTILRQSLSDGSIVWLHPGTRLTYKKAFAKNKREVQMSGDAFFDVAKDKSRPFIIESGGVTTKVLGTSFRIKAPENGQSTEVFVLTGKVNVKVSNPASTGSNEVMLCPDQAVLYIKDEKRLVKSRQDEKSLKMWRKTELSFDNRPVAEVIKAINEEFGVNIWCANPALEQYVIKADFTGQNLADILEMLKSSLNINYELGEEKIVLK